MFRFLTLFLLSSLTLAHAQPKTTAPTAARTVVQDKQGVIRWTDNNQEVALFGANYCLPSACDYRAAGYVSNDRKKMVDQDMTHFARMGWDGLRLCLWGDFENTDFDGNLIANDHLDLMDYLILKAKERNIYMLLSPIVTYSSQWPDAMQDTTSARGFSTHFNKGELGTNPKAIAAQQNYLRQLLDHVNPYTGVALKDEPSILFVEMINEPWHHSKDVAGSVAYIDALIDAVRSTGCTKLVFHNVSQDFDISESLQKSKIQGASFAWYPSGLVSGHTLSGNYLPVVDDYSLMLNPKLKGLSRLVYEFDSPDLLNGYMYPAMARSFRRAGAQFAAMFAYDMLATAPFNLGWQTHYFNMVYTPTKAIGGMIAAEVMRQIPLYKDYGKYPANTTFGPFRISYADNLSEMVTADEFMYSNTTKTSPQNPKTLTKVVGYGSSPVVRYEGKGLYFLDKIKDGTWRLEVYPDAVQIDDPFKMPSPDKVVTRSISRPWPMQLRLPDLRDSFVIQPLNEGNSYRAQAKNGEFSIQPGVYILTTEKNISLQSLPTKIGNLGMTEYVMLPDQTLPTQVVADYQSEYRAEQPIRFSARVYSAKEPQNVTLFMRYGGSGRYASLPMKRETGYTYTAELPASRATEGLLDYCIVVDDGLAKINYPSGLAKSPADWDFYGAETWSAKVVKPQTPLRLLSPAEDVSKLNFTRIGDGIRSGIYKLIPASNTGEASIHLELPLSYDKKLEDYTVSVPIQSKMLARKADLDKAKTLKLTVKGQNQQQQAYITLVENDGTSWSQKIALLPDWKELTIPLANLKLSQGAMLPLGYPGRWAYWFTPASGRGTPNDRVRLENVAWIQLSIRQSDLKKEEATANSWIDITSALLSFE